METNISKIFSFKKKFLCTSNDLLNKQEIELEIEKISDFYKNKIILMTGASGSIGSEILMYLLQLPIKKIIAFNHSEFGCYNSIQKMNHKHIIDYVLGDIRDIEKLDYVFNKYKPDICIHAAAQKHVYFSEQFPDEAIKTNILGSYNCITIAIKHNVKQFISISTDKAVNPTSIMGATKNIVEKMILSFNKIQNTTKFSFVRFGNVLNSKGSFLPLFINQIENNQPLTITHPDMKRFFMSISEASKLVIKSITLNSGDIYILDMGEQIKIIDIAKKLIELYGKDSEIYPIKYIGTLNGEKLDEELTIDPNNLQKTKFDRLLTLKNNEHDLSNFNRDSVIKDFIKVAETYDKQKIIEMFKFYIRNFIHD
jgi:FlaA1/EpsC-like NDP-sugar epimerase